MTELLWDGKYDAQGRRARHRLPQQRQRALDLFAARRDPEWRNRLIWGDKKYTIRLSPALGLVGFVSAIGLLFGVLLRISWLFWGSLSVAGPWLLNSLLNRFPSAIARSGC